MKPAQEFYSWYVVNCVFNVFLSYTAIMLNIVTIHAIRKTPSLSKPLKTLLLSLAVSDLGVGLTAQPLYVIVRVMQLKQTDHSPTYYATYIAFLVSGNLFNIFFVFSCGCFNYRQILGYSPLSQIQGTCDSQARCCCGDLHMGFQRNSLAYPIVGPGQYHLAFLIFFLH